MWAKLRGASYGTSIAVIFGTLLAAMGYVTFDIPSGVMVVPEFTVNLYSLAAGLPVLASPIVALTALVKGWGRK